MQKKIIIPLPSFDFDPSEVAVSWQILRDAGHHVDFATVDGKRGFADPIMLSGEGLDPWGFIPGLKKIKCFGLLLRANKSARHAYSQLEKNTHFLHPKRYSDISVNDYHGLFLPGGHAPGMKQYLEDTTLQSIVADFFDNIDTKAIAAVCHGVVLAARSISKDTGRSSLYGRKTTALPWTLERNAWLLSKYLCRFWDNTYYRTYSENGTEPTGHRSVEMEVKRALRSESDFIDVPPDTPNAWLKNSGLFRDNINDDRPALVVCDGHYLSARWPGDLHTLATQFTKTISMMHTRDPSKCDWTC